MHARPRGVGPCLRPVEPALHSPLRAAAAPSTPPRRPSAAQPRASLPRLHAAAAGLAAAAAQRRARWARRGRAQRRAAGQRQGADTCASGAGAAPPGLGEWFALVVNLERRDDRLQKTRQLLAETNPRVLERMERLDAVDGRSISLDDEALLEIVEPRTLERARRAKDLGIYTVVHDTDNILVHFDDHLTEGAIACAMSHRKALERVATHPVADWGLILEDDVSVVVPEVDWAIARIMEQLPEDWTAVYLGYHHDDGKPHPRGLRIGQSTEPVAASGEAAVCVPVGGVYDHCWGLFAWMVRKDTARDLLKNLFPIDTQIDGAISSWLVRTAGPGRVFKVPPEELLFYSSCSEEAQDSDIQTMAAEGAVVEEYGSWGAYMQQLQRPSPYEEAGLEDLYGLYGDTGEYDFYDEEAPEDPWGDGDYLENVADAEQHQ